MDTAKFLIERYKNNYRNLKNEIPDTEKRLNFLLEEFRKRSENDFNENDIKILNTLETLTNLEETEEFLINSLAIKKTYSLPLLEELGEDEELRKLEDNFFKTIKIRAYKTKKDFEILKDYEELDKKTDDIEEKKEFLRNILRKRRFFGLQIFLRKIVYIFSLSFFIIALFTAVFSLFTEGFFNFIIIFIFSLPFLFLFLFLYEKPIYIKEKRQKEKAPKKEGFWGKLFYYLGIYFIVDWLFFN